MALQSSSTSAILALPQELRSQIYSGLLCPKPDHPLTLFCAPQGRPAALDIHPAILRSNKQIYREALPLLYSNVYKFDLTNSYQGPTCCSPGQDFARLFLSTNVQILESTRDWVYAEDGKLLSTKATIYPSAFRQLRHVEILTADHAVFGWGMLGSYWSQCGYLVNRILGYLGGSTDMEGEDMVTTTSTLKFDFLISHDMNAKDKDIFGAKGMWAESLENMREMLALLEAVKNRRIVAVRGHNGHEEMDLSDWMNSKCS